VRFIPDLVVSSADGPSLELMVVVKTHVTNATTAVLRSEMRKYMVGMRCPVGMLVTPRTTEVLYDTYANDAPDSIESAGEFSTPVRLAAGATKGAYAFEREVQDWLERLATAPDPEDLEEELRDALKWHVLPALAGGHVVATGPRAPKAAAG
jgi:hypothetical protein